MKKNFLKKLAFTMAFATAFTALSPAAGVFAAAKPSLTVGKTLTLLLGTEREEHDINVKNKVAGSKYAWSTSNKAIATVDSKGVVEGQKVGSAKVTLKITLPTKKTQTLTTNVDVKDNIKEVAINNAPTEALKVGQEHDFNRTIVSTFGGNTKAHKGAITRWEVKDAEGKATETATIDDKGVFVATEAGKYTVEAISFQSKAKYADYVKTANQDLVTARSAAAEVEVVATLTSVKQVDSKKVNAIFNGSIEDTSKFEVYSVAAGDVRVKQIVKEVKLDATKKVATVELYVDFVPGTTYVVVTPDAGEASFVAATKRVEDVASILVDTKEAVVNTATPINYKLLNADGVDISTPELKARVTLENSSDKAFFSGNDLIMSSIGDVTNITLKFHTYEYDAQGNEIIKVQTVAPIVCVATPSVIAGGINAYTLSTGNPDYAKPVHRVALRDSNYTLYVEAIKNDANKTKVSSQGNFEFTYESTNENILIVNATTGAVHTVAQGSAQVLVKYNNVVIGTVTITVVAERTAVNVGLSTNRVNLSSSLDEVKNVTVTVKDQLDGNVTGKEVSVSKLAGSPDSQPLLTGNRFTNNDGKITLAFNGVGKDAGTYTYRISVGNIVTTITVVVAAPSTGATVRERLDVADKFDMAIKNNDVNKAVTFNVYSVASNGVDRENVTTSSAFKVTLFNDKNEEVQVITNGKFDLVTAGVDADKNNAPIWEKAKTGRYRLEVRRISDNDLRDVKYFVVEDNQKAPTLTKVKGLETNAGSIEAAIADLFEIKLDNVEYSSAIVGVSSTGNVAAGSAYVYSVTVKQTIKETETSTGRDIFHKVNINQPIKFK